MLNNLLKSLNFTDKEAAVYLALLEIGPAKARDVSLKTQLNRTTVYDIFTSLLEKGLVSKFGRGKTISFNALSPERLLNYLDREKEGEMKKIDKQKEKVKNILPQLISLQNIFSSGPKVQFFEGEKGMREAYEDTLTSKDIILAYANLETMQEGLPNFFPEYFKRRAAKKIFIRAILPRNEASIKQSKSDLEEARETRFLPEAEMTFSPEINIYNNKMLVASWKEKIAIIIESKELADLQKLTFNLLWASLPKNSR